MAVHLAVAADKIEVPDTLRNKVGDEAVVETVGDPRPERVHPEEDALLAELIKLRVAVEKASRNELIEDAHDQGRENGEEDVIER